MKTRSALPALSAFALIVGLSGGAIAGGSAHEFQFTTIDGKPMPMSQYKGKTVLVVNTASQCGFTPQYKGLEAVHQKYKGKLAVVGFASNDFNQESADEAKSAEICFLNNGVTFPVMAATKVKGAEANPVFIELNKQASEPKWNFNKYLVTADGKVAKYFPQTVTPESAEFTAEIEKLLN